MLEFEWDESKNLTNIEKHGINFEDAKRIFENWVVTNQDTRFEYGEIREISFGKLDGAVVLTVVHTDRSGRRRLISARYASKKERQLYEDEFAKRRRH